MRTVAIPEIAADKALHYVWGSFAALAGLCTALLIAAAGRPLPVAPEIVGALACLAAALLREAWNVKSGGRWSWADVVATLFGGAAVLAPAAIT